jgi:HAD superfamily hydrolase (TIGR01484 family)
MRFHVLACDYDGTLATHGKVDEATLAALNAVQASGRRLLLVTGRRLEELLRIFPEAERFDRIVAENGALCFDPATKKEEVLAEPPPSTFVEELLRRGVAPIEVGRTIVATWEPHEVVALEVIRDLGLGLQIILNKGAVMILPGQVNKATGLAHALRQLGYSPHNTVAVGDAENDHALLAYCGCGAAVWNAVQALKDRADVVLQRDHGAGVQDLIGQMLDNDLGVWSADWTRHNLKLGPLRSGGELTVPSCGRNVWIEATNANSLSSMLTVFTEKLTAQSFQWCAVSESAWSVPDDDAVRLGTESRAPSIDELKHALENPKQRVVLNCAHLNALDRTPFLTAAVGEFSAMRQSHGRPHWLLWIDGQPEEQSAMRSASEAIKQLGGGMLFASTQETKRPPFGEQGNVLHFVDDALERRPGNAIRYGVQDGALWFESLSSTHP